MASRLIGVLVLLAAAIQPLTAATLTLTDGTVLEGTVIKQGNGYWIKTADGQTRTIPASDVQAVDTAAPKPKPAAAAPAKPVAPATKAPQGGTDPGQASGKATPAGREAAPVASAAAPARSESAFESAKHRADAAAMAWTAVAVWQGFLDHATTDEPAANLESAKAEMDRWQQLAEAGAEKVNGKWVAGEELAAILREYTKAHNAAWNVYLTGTLDVVKKAEEAATIYPHHVWPHVVSGRYALTVELSMEFFPKNSNRKLAWPMRFSWAMARKHYEAALPLWPSAAETLSNLGVCDYMEKRYASGLKLMHRAAQLRTNTPIVHNFVHAAAAAPRPVKEDPALRYLMEAAAILRPTLGGGDGPRPLIPIEEAMACDIPTEHFLRMKAYGGSGILINDQGLILTSRAHAERKNGILVVLDDGRRHAGRVVAIDDVHDLALVQIRSPQKTPYLALTDVEPASGGTAFTVVGYPMLQHLGATLATGSGRVDKSTQAFNRGSDLTCESKMDPGYGGGPVADEFGNVFAMASLASFEFPYSGAQVKAVSARTIREFLKRNNIEAAPAAAASAAPMPLEDMVKNVRPAVVYLLASH